MGYRAIRICLKQTDIFRIQLRALLRASMYGNLSVMYPMITAVWEVEQIHDILEDVCKELVQRCLNNSEKQCLIFVTGQGGGRRQCGGIVD